MTIHRTTDEEKIRTWVEKNDGKPAVVSDDTQGDNNGALTIVFSDQAKFGYKEIEWIEFFDTLNSSGLRFRFDDSLSKENAEWAYGFEGTNEATDSSDETLLPEDIDYINENMFPSSP